MYGSSEQVVGELAATLDPAHATALNDEADIGVRWLLKAHPLPNLFVSMLQRLGLETDRFATSTGTMRGLDVA